ncbi:MAG TPA: hypothetical protein VI541_00330, partial [Actinomycetota bacterium]|nr:hypothetical protein [Actinomycetota bacterium]
DEGDQMRRVRRAVFVIVFALAGLVPVTAALALPGCVGIVDHNCTIEGLNCRTYVVRPNGGYLCSIM